MKDDTSTPTTEGSSPNEFERGKPGTAARDQAEAAIEKLRREGGVFVDAVRATRMAMAITDPTLPGDPIVFANESFLKLSGYRMDEVLGQQPHFLNGAGTDPNDAARFAEALRNDQDDLVETVQYRKNGSRFVATVLLSAFKNDEGQTIHHLLSWLDVTRRVDAEGQVADLRKTQSLLRQSEAARREGEERHAFLLKLTDALRRIRDAGDIQATTARMVAEHLRADRSMYAEVEGAEGVESGRIRGQYVRRRGEGAATVPFPEYFTYGQCGEHTMAARNRGDPLIVADVQDDPKYSVEDRAAWAKFGVRAAVVAALTKDRQLVAEFGVHSTTAREWTESEIALVQEAAERTWAAAERARAEAALRESEDKYRSLFESMDEAYAVVEVLEDDSGNWVDFRFVEVNPAFLEHTNMPPPVGKTATELLGTPNPRWTELYGQALDTGEALRVEEGEPTLGITFDLNIFTLDREKNRVAVLFTNITERKQSEQALRESEERQAFLLTLSDALRPLSDPTQIQFVASRMLTEQLNVLRAGFGELDGGELIVRADYSPSASSVIGRYTVETFGPTLANIYRNGGTAVLRDADTDSGITDEERDLYRSLRVSAHVTVAICSAGQPVISLGVQSADSRDWSDADIALIKEVAERTWAAVARARAENALRESERHAKMLLAELQHRVRNTLGMVRSIARRTAENSHSVESMLGHFQGRLDAFSRAQAALTRSPDAIVDLASLIEDEMLAHAAREGEQVSIGGPDVQLEPKNAERLSLAIHELTTNAVKHGAFVTPVGKVRIQWTVEPDDRGGSVLCLRWSESGVSIDPVEARRKGFGMELLERSLPYDLQAETAVEFRPTGLHFELRMPLADRQRDN